MGAGRRREEGTEGRRSHSVGRGNPQGAGTDAREVGRDAPPRAWSAGKRRGLNHLGSH